MRKFALLVLLPMPLFYAGNALGAGWGRRRRLLIFASATAALIVGADSVFADEPPITPAYCANYAKLAAHGAEEARQLACGFDLHANRWASTDPEPHYQWCLSASFGEVESELSERLNDLLRCQNCRGYANKCQAQDRQARKFHCTFKYGDVCTTFQYCMWLFTLDPGASGLAGVSAQYQQGFYDVIPARDNDLNQCKAAKKDQIDFCNKYVDQTRESVVAINNRCDIYYGDNRYVPDDDIRFEWCFDLQGSPGGDPNYMTNGQDPVQYIRQYATACTQNALKSSPKDVLPSVHPGGKIQSPSDNSGHRSFEGDKSRASRGPGPDGTKPGLQKFGKQTKPGGMSSSSKASGSGGSSAMDRLGDVNSGNLGAVSGNAGGAQVGRSPAPTAGAAPSAGTGAGANTGLGAGRLMMSPPPRIDSPSSPSDIH